MTFAAPIWLLLLVPWAALSLWLMLGRRQRVAVPFIELWQSTDAPPREFRASLRPPPFALVCLLLAMLIGLLAAARPAVRIAHQHVTLIIDRGVAMSGDAVDLAMAHFNDAGKVQMPFATLDIVQVPGNRVPVDWWDFYEQLSPASAVNTHDMLLAAIRDSLCATQDPIFVVTTQKIQVSDPRVTLVQLPAPKNVGIVMVSARVSPRPAAMVRLRNQSDKTRATLQVQSEQRAVELPPRGQSRDYFFDLAEALPVIAIKLQVEDEFAADNEARLVRGPSWPKIEAISALPAEVQRMIDIYSRHRPSSDKSERVVITDNVFRVPATQPAIILPRVSGTLGPVQLRVVDHPITASVDFTSEVSADAAIADPPGEGWTPIVSAGEKVLLAVRDKPARSVWVGFRAERFARQPGFVVMWTNIFDWVGGGDDSPAAEYRADALDIDFPDSGIDPPTDIPKQLTALLKQARTTLGGTEFSSHLLLAALGLVVLAAATWARPRGRPVPSHVSSQGLA